MTNYDRFRWWVPVALVLISWVLLTGCASGHDLPWGAGTAYQDQAEYCTAARRDCDRDKALPLGGDWPEGVPPPQSCGAVARDC